MNDQGTQGWEECRGDEEPHHILQHRNDPLRLPMRSIQASADELDTLFARRLSDGRAWAVGGGSLVSLIPKGGRKREGGEEGKGVAKKG